MTLVFVRHGESEGNATRTVQGWLDVALTARGRAQAEATAARLAAEPVAAVYSSSLARALETARVIAEPHGLAVTALDDLREYGYGEAQGLRWEDVHARWPHDAEEWGVGHIPGEEGGAVFRARVAAAFDVLAERHRREMVVIASHGGAINQVLAHVLGLPVGARAHTTVENCALTVIETDGRRPVLAGLNDGRHLRLG